jgi:hypothetical protein
LKRVNFLALLIIFIGSRYHLKRLPMKIPGLLFLFLVSTAAIAQNTWIIPQPVSLTTRPGTFTLSGKTVMVVGHEEDHTQTGEKAIM